MEPQETFTYTYNLTAGKTHLEIIILVETDTEKPNHYTFSLTMKIGDVERAICKPVSMRLTIDPRGLDFVVFAFPPRAGLPAGCLYNLRVWLRTTSADHRLFGEKDLWFGKDPDFNKIIDASFTSLRNSTHDMWVYQGLVGRAHVTFIIRHKLVEPGIYALSLEYDAGGVGRTLFENYRLRFYCEPHTVSYLIYSIPVASTPAGASHRLRVWLRTPHRPHNSRSRSHSRSSSSSSSDSHLYQRLWKSDDFKVGANLHFEAIGKTIVLGTRASPSSGSGSASASISDGYGSPTSSLDPSLMPLTPNRRRVSRLTTNVSAEDAEDSINDR